MGALIFGIIVVCVSAILGVWSTRVQAKALDPVVVIPAPRWLTGAGLLASSLILLTSFTAMIVAVTPLSELFEVDNAPLAFSVGLAGVGMGGLVWLAVRHWPITGDSSGLYFGFFRVRWEAIRRIRETDWMVYVDGEPAAWNNWTGRTAFPLLLWSATHDEWQKLWVLREEHEGVGTALSTL